MKRKKQENGTDLKYSMQSVNSALLVVPEDTYQRPLNKKRVDQIVAAFDENIANEPKVSYRDGHYYLFDGRHTTEVRKVLNGGNDLEIRCKVYTGLTPAQEALLFAEQTGYSALPTPGNRLRARLYAKEADALAFREATENGGFLLNLDGPRSDDHISCINTALRMYHKLKAEKYELALNILRTAWNGSADSLLDQIVIAVCEFVRIYNGKFNRYNLIDALKHYKPREVYARIESDFTHPGYKRNVAQIYRIYNASCGQQKLPMLF